MKRAAQLYVFGVGPDWRAGCAGGFTAKKLERRDVGGVPDLFGKQAALSCGRVFDDGEQCFGLIGVPGCERVMAALSGEQGPRASYARPVEGGAIFVFPVAVAVVAIPAWALGQLDR